jgi:DnaJ-domain-containing protein 1
MDIGPEHIVAVIGAVAGYAVVSGIIGFRNKRVSARKANSRSESSSNSKERSGSESGPKPGSNTRSQKKQQWFEVLGVSPSASLDQIKSAYRAKISGYHPDKVATLADELKILAEERSKEINDAYATALRLRT